MVCPHLLIYPHFLVSTISKQPLPIKFAGSLPTISAEAQPEALLEIINTSARQAIAEYKKGGDDVPTIHSKTFHPIDFATDTVALTRAIAQSFDWACMGIVLRTGIADTLAKYPRRLHVNELSRIVGLEKGKLARVLRVLASKGCFTEVVLYQSMTEPEYATSYELDKAPLSYALNMKSYNRKFL
ncbi:hypothetical protein BU15DRAFT_63493 [Melanogaster broomeanus]|nr:hypothetical protein BU15DRAFT_63493 [Melanogaster broomeanus]